MTLGKAGAMPRVDDILDFWFGRPGDAGYGGKREIWFEKNDDFDAEIRDRFMADHEAAEAGRLDPMQRTARGALALVIVLDQFPRNMFRGEARAFATDAQAREVAGAAIACGFDLALTPVERRFFYLPFEHGETLADQARCAWYMREHLPPDDERDASIGHARRHRVIIERFGRFPHRNAALGRTSTPEEIAFLEEPNSSF